MDSGRQVQIDLMLQLWQEAQHLWQSVGIFASGVASATINLVDGQNDYALPAAWERMAGHDRDQRVWRGVTNGLLVREYPGGYAQLRADRPVATDYIGDPQFWAINPVSGLLTFDTFADSSVDGNSYHALYHKRLFLTSTMATETLPFSDTVADGFVPVVAEGWQRIMKKEFDSALFQASLVRAIQYGTQTTDRARYGVRRR